MKLAGKVIRRYVYFWGLKILLIGPKSPLFVKTQKNALFQHKLFFLFIERNLNLKMSKKTHENQSMSMSMSI